ncbi:MAG: hypothetical protein Q9218_006871, partial [Villophora microphyllina]
MAATNVVDMVKDIGAVHETVITGFGEGVSDDRESSPRSSTQQPAPQQQPLGSFTNAGDSWQPLDEIVILWQGQQPVLDEALNYLDQVKARCVDPPDVYHRLLDIMKDFESQA